MDENISARFNYCHIIPLTRKSHGTEFPWLAETRGTPPARQAAACHVAGKETARKTFGGVQVPRQTPAATLMTWRIHTAAKATRWQQWRPVSAQLLTRCEFSPVPVITSLLCCPFWFKQRPPCPVRASSPRAGLCSVRSRQSSWQVPHCGARGLKHSAPCPQAHMHHFWWHLH